MDVEGSCQFFDSVYTGGNFCPFNVSDVSVGDARYLRKLLLSKSTLFSEPLHLLAKLVSEHHIEPCLVVCAQNNGDLVETPGKILPLGSTSVL